MLEIRLAAKKSLKKPWNKTTKAKQPICEKISFDFTNKKHYLKKQDPHKRTKDRDPKLKIEKKANPKTTKSSTRV